MSKDKITEVIKEYARNEMDMDLVGIADAQALADEPDGHRPEQILPGAKSIIVFGRAIAMGAIEAEFRFFEDGMSPAQSAYAAFGSDLGPNFTIVNDSFNLCCFIEDAYDEIAAPLPFGPQQGAVWDVVPGPMFCDPYAQGMPINIFKAAVAAGVGEYGWSNRIVTEEYGPRVVLAAVITTLDLVADGPRSGARLCDPGACGVCAKMCPTGAIEMPNENRGCFKKVLGNEYETADLKVNSCIIASMAYRKEFQGRIPVPDQILGNDASDQELESAFARKPLNGLSVDHYPRYFCDKCLLYCPLGKWNAHYFEKGLSEVDVESMKISAG